MPNPHIRLLKFIILFKNCFKPFPYNKSICKDDTFYVLLKRKRPRIPLKKQKMGRFSSFGPAPRAMNLHFGDKCSGKLRKNDIKIRFCDEKINN
jgi:hypothetical protein